MIKIIVNPDDELIRLDKFIVAHYKEVSRSELKYYFDEQKVMVNNKIVKPSYLVNYGDEIIIMDRDEKESNLEKEDIKLDIVYEDEDIIVVNKPSGMVVHPANGNYEHTLVNALMYHSNKLSSVNGEFRPGIVHRIDADTSGLLLVAKTDNVHNDLAKQISEKSVTRKYICLVNGVILEDTATIDAPIGRDKNDRKKMCVTGDNSKDAVTNIRVLERYKDSTLVECVLETGRTHQIRVHMSYIGHPVVNDPVYGYNKLIDKDFGQMLHAEEIGFIHPITKEYLDFKVDPPKRFMEILEIYKNKE